MKAVCLHFQSGEGPRRDLLCDCEIYAKVEKDESSSADGLCSAVQLDHQFNSLIPLFPK